MPERYTTMATLSAPAHRHLGQNALDPAWDPVREWLLDFMSEHGIETHVSMMVPGLDQVTDAIVRMTGRKSCVVRPFPGHEKPWPPLWREYAETAVASADEVITICEARTPTSVAMANTKITDMADVLVAINADDSAVVARAVERCQIRDIPVYLSDRDGARTATFKRL